MKNVTVSVPDEVYRLARIRAAENNTSVSSMVADFLRGAAGDSDAEFDRLREMQREVSQQIDHVRAGERLTRDDVHDRAALR